MIADELKLLADRMRNCLLADDFYGACENLEDCYSAMSEFEFDTIECAFDEWDDSKADNAGKVAEWVCPLESIDGLTRRRFNVARAIWIGFRQTGARQSLSCIVDEESVNQLLELCNPVFQLDEIMTESMQQLDELQSNFESN